MTPEDFHKFFPFVVMGVCYVIGKIISNTSKIPNWIIPPVLTLTGLVSGIAMAVINGGTWQDAAMTALMGLLSGAGTVGLHQTYRQPSDAMKAKKEAGSNPPPVPPADSTQAANPPTTPS